MAELKTTYLGLTLKNPVIAGASTMTKNLDTIKKIEDTGAAALVTSSLFEEEIQLKRYKFDEDLSKFDEKHPEMIHIFPDLEHAGPAEHLMWVRKAKEAVSIPVIGSLNTVNVETIEDYAQQMEQTGVDAIELNLYRFPSDSTSEAQLIEANQIKELTTLLDSISIPVSVKLSPFYTNPLNIVSKLDAIGVSGYVLFNRFFQPDIDIDEEKNTFPFHLSNREDLRLPLRYTGLLYGDVKGDICGSTGIMNGEDAVKLLLAGASSVQVVSTLYKNKVSVIGSILEEIESWMKKKGYNTLDEFRGKLSRKNSNNPAVYERAQYVKMLLNPDIITKNYPAL